MAAPEKKPETPPKETDTSRLRCMCGSPYFRPKVHLKVSPGGGTVPEPAGYTCRICDADADLGTLLRIREVERKKAELRDLQREVGAEKAPA